MWILNLQTATRHKINSQHQQQVLSPYRTSFQSPKLPTNKPKSNNSTEVYSHTVQYFLFILTANLETVNQEFSGGNRIHNQCPDFDLNCCLHDKTHACSIFQSVCSGPIVPQTIREQPPKHLTALGFLLMEPYYSAHIVHLQNTIIFFKKHAEQQCILRVSLINLTHDKVRTDMLFFKRDCQWYLQKNE